MKHFNGYYSKEVSSNLRKVQIHSAYFDTIEYRKTQIDAGWKELKPQLSKNWEHIWFDRSISIHNHKLGINIKVSLCNEIFIDRRIGKFEFKSDKYYSKSVDEAVAKMKEVFAPYIYKKQEVDTPQPVLVA